jgi:predicted enzyme related to lactoylglutathione lyase
MADVHVVIDCRDPVGLAGFSAEALGYAKLAALDAYVVLAPKDEDGGPPLVLQRVPEPKATKNRVHLDVVAPDVEAEVERLAGLGAERVEGGAYEEHGVAWVQMRDPEGNEFCVCQGWG